MSADGRHRRILCVLLLLPLPLFLPYLWLDHVYFWANPDSIFYINVYASYRDALWQGEVFPHWISHVNAGLGSLVFYSLSPLVFHITALLSAPFGLTELNQYLFGMYLSQVFAGWAMWRWMRCHFDNATALCAAALFVFVPYKWMDFYQHFTLGQCFAIAFLPLWMRSAERLHERGGIVLYGVAAALTFYAHALTVISTGPLVAAYALHRAGWQWRLVLRPLLAANLLAFLLVAAYLAAMVTALPWQDTLRWSDANFNPLKNLYHIDDFIGSYALLLIWLAWRARHKLVSAAPRGQAGFCMAALAVLYALATPLSYPLWANLPVMAIFQFPFPRLQPGMAVLVVMLATLLLAGRLREYRVAVAAVYVLFTALVLMHLHLVYKRPRELSMRVREIAAQYRIIPAHIHYPRWTNIQPNDVLLGHKRFHEKPLIEVKDGEAVIDNAVRQSAAISAGIAVQGREATLVVSQFYIPAWRATLDGNPLEATPYADGLIRLTVPEGRHRLELRVTRSVLEKTGDLLTLAGLLAVAAHCASGYHKRRV